MRNDPEKPWLNNREKTRAPKMGKFYCDCDFNMVHQGEKCVVCGRIMGRKRNKKD